MNAVKNKELIQVDYFFCESFGRDRDYPSTVLTDRERVYLDLTVGRLHYITITENPEIYSDKSKYLEILGLSHSEQHAIFQEFVKEWNAENQQARYEYFGSIGGWLKGVKRDLSIQDIGEDWRCYRDGKVEELAKKFLESISIEDRQYVF